MQLWELKYNMCAAKTRGTTGMDKRKRPTLSLNKGSNNSNVIHMGGRKDKKEGEEDKSSRKILILGSGSYALPFKEHGKLTLVNPIKFNIKLFDISQYNLIVFTGGQDVHPSLYNQSPHKYTNPLLARDYIEKEVYEVAKKNHIPMVGICRGSQFLTVMNGGTLIQHVSNHTRNHPILTQDGECVMVTSTHHQMMAPNKHKRKGYSLLAYSEGLSNDYDGDPDVKVTKAPPLGRAKSKLFMEPEVIYYKDSKCLAVQYHPEYMSDKSNGWLYFQYLLENYVLE